MKRIHLIYLLLAVCAILPKQSSAQLRYGFRLGGEFASAKLIDAGDASMVNRTGFSGGVVFEYQFPKCGFAPEIAIIYTRYNTRLAEPGVKPVSCGRNLIELPLHLKYKFWIPAFHDLFGPMIYTGPSLSCRISDDAKAPMNTRRLQPRWDVGIGFDIVNFIQISGGYRFGLGNPVRGYPDHPEADLKTDGWNVSATLLFDF